MTDRRTQQDVPMLRMTETSIELEDLPEDQHDTPDLLSESQPEPPRQPKYGKLPPLVLALFLFAVILGGICIRYGSPTWSSHRTTAPPCLSAACDWASARLSTSADPFTQPCDYFLFTCGFTADTRGTVGQNRSERSLREAPARGRRGSLLQHLRQILESIDEDSSAALRTTRTFYTSCLDTGSIERAGVEPFLKLIQELGGWAVSGQWAKADFNTTLGVLMRDYATFPFFNVYVDTDPEDPVHGATKHYIQIDQPDLLIPIEWNNESKRSQVKTQTLRPFLATCQRYLTLLGARDDKSLLHVGHFLSLSSNLAVAASPEQYRLSKGQLHQRMSIRELQLRAPEVDWLRCLRAAFHPTAVTEDDPVFVHNLPFMVNMSLIIRDWLNKPEHSDVEPLQTFMVLNLLHTMMPALDSRFANASRASSGQQADPRWERCVMETEKGFGSVLTHLLSERTAHPEAQEVIDNIFSAFKSKLQQLELTNQTTRWSVVDKVNSLNPKLWTSREIPDEDELDSLHSKVSMEDHKFFSNYVALLSLWQQRQRKLLGGRGVPVDILSVTPRLLGNELLFPMGMFVPPLFHPTYPRAMNYGVVGFLIAKDLLHLFLPNIHSQSETVKDVGGCVWTHYLTVTGKAGGAGGAPLTAAQQQEVWVQYTALQMALQAYHLNLKTRPEDTSVSGLSYTRLFLSSFSQMNCDNDPHHESMPLEPSFLITVFCAGSHLCPAGLQCPRNAQQHSLQKC